MRRRGLQLLAVALGVSLMLFLCYGAKELFEFQARGLAAAAHPSYTAVNTPHSDRTQHWIEWAAISSLLFAVVWIWQHPPQWSIDNHPDSPTPPE